MYFHCHIENIHTAIVYSMIDLPITYVPQNPDSVF